MFASIWRRRGRLRGSADVDVTRKRYDKSDAGDLDRVPELLQPGIDSAYFAPSPEEFFDAVHRSWSDTKTMGETLARD